jgi:elongation factor G
MPRFTVATIRNLCLVGPAGAGKTTLCEAMLKQAGAISSAGSVEKGNTVSDFDAMEKERLHSLNTSMMSFDYADQHINLLDAPGLSDFRGAALVAMAAVDTVAVVVSAVHGIDAASVKLLERAKARGNQRVVIVNKIDVDGTNPQGVLTGLREMLGSECLPINLPTIGRQSVVDCFFNAIGVSEFSSVASTHQQIIDQVVEINPSVMEHYLEDGEAKLTPEELHDAFEQSLREGHLIPVLFTSARTGAGVQNLLDTIVRLFPHPGESNPPPFLKGEGPDAVSVPALADADKHVIAHVFKIINDPFMGKLSVFRIYQGTIKKDTQLYVGDGKKSFRVGHLYKLFGKSHCEIDSATAGDICAIAKVEDIHYDAVLHDSHDEDHWHLLPLTLPKSMYGLSVQPSTRGQEQKLSGALHKLVEEDPTFHVEHHAELNETVIQGLGDLHLKVMLARLKDRFQVDVKTAPPRVAYRETIAVSAVGHYRHKKQTGGAGQFGEVFLRIRPLERGEGVRFVDDTKGGSIPYNFIPAVEKGVRQAIQQGAVAGYAMQDIEVSAYDGKHHPVDSKEIAFVSAGKHALLDAVSKAGPMLLEPIVDLQVTVPDTVLGGLSAMLSGKRARIVGTDSHGVGDMTLQAQVPLAELGDFQSELTALTAATGSYSMEFSHYDAVPVAVQKRLIEAYRPHVEED